MNRPFLKLLQLGLLVTAAAVPLSPALAQKPNSALEQKLSVVEDLRQRTDPAGLLEYAEYLFEGIPDSSTNPLITKYPEQAYRLVVRALETPGPHEEAGRLLLAKILLSADIDERESTRILETLRPLVERNNVQALSLQGEVLADLPGRREDARASLQLAARMGYLPALLELSSNPSLAARSTKGLEDFALSAIAGRADAGDAGSAYLLGDYYLTQPGSDAVQEALKWFRKAADLKHKTAVYRVAQLLLRKDLPSYDPVAAHEFTLGAAQVGHVAAARAILENFVNEGPMPTSVEEFQYWSQRLLEINDPKGIRYYSAHVENSINERAAFSASLLERILSGKISETGEMVKIGRMFETGDGVSLDPEGALRIYQAAAEKGATSAVVRAGALLLKHPSLRTRELTAWVADALMQASAEENIHAPIVLGDFYRDGILEGSSFEKARQAYARAFEISANQAAARRMADLLLSQEEIGVRREALPWLQKAAELGGGKALLTLARLHFDGKLVPRDPKKAMEFYGQAADAGITDGLLELADLYLELGEDDAFENASRLFRESIELGNQEAIVEMARFLVRFNRIEEAIPLYEQAAGLGEFSAAMELYKLSAADPEQRDQAGKWLVMAADNVGNSVENKLELASVWLEIEDETFAGQAIAMLQELTDAGVHKADFILADAYLHGRGVAQNVDRALEMLQARVADSDPEAAVMLGDLYMDGELIGRDGSLAETEYLAALRFDPNHVNAHYRLGRLYSTAKFGVMNKEAAEAHLRFAADRGSRSGMRELAMLQSWTPASAARQKEIESLLAGAAENGIDGAWYDLGRFHAAGLAKPVDRRKAFISAYKDARKSYGAAMIDVGVALMAGFGTPRDVEAGLAWLDAASALRDAPEIAAQALYVLHEIYAQGFGVAPDAGKAESLLSQAAGKGNPSSMFKIGLAMMKDADEQSAEYREAISWLKKAQQQEHNHANKLLAALGYPEIKGSSHDE